MHLRDSWPVPTLAPPRPMASFCGNICHFSRKKLYSHRQVLVVESAGIKNHLEHWPREGEMLLLFRKAERSRVVNERGHTYYINLQKWFLTPALSFTSLYKVPVQGLCLFAPTGESGTGKRYSWKLIGEGDSLTWEPIGSDRCCTCLPAGTSVPEAAGMAASF